LTTAVGPWPTGVFDWRKEPCFGKWRCNIFVSNCIGEMLLRRLRQLSGVFNIYSYCKGYVLLAIFYSDLNFGRDPIRDVRFTSKPVKLIEF
jgi:hypothetical protein